MNQSSTLVTSNWHCLPRKFATISSWEWERLDLLRKPVAVSTPVNNIKRGRFQNYETPVTIRFHQWTHSILKVARKFWKKNCEFEENVWQSHCMSVCMSVWLFACLAVSLLSALLSMSDCRCRTVCLNVYLYAGPSVGLWTCLSVCPYVCLDLQKNCKFCDNLFYNFLGNFLTNSFEKNKFSFVYLSRFKHRISATHPRARSLNRAVGEWPVSGRFAKDCVEERFRIRRSPVRRAGR